MRQLGTKSHPGQTAFTLLEIVLAIGLSSVVLYLLMTAIELYLFRVDGSRARVESAQLARTLLDQIAGDLAAARFSIAIGPGGGNQAAGGQGGASSGGGNQSQNGASQGAGNQGAAASGGAGGGAQSGGLAPSGKGSASGGGAMGGQSGSSPGDAGNAAGTGGAGLMNSTGVQGVYGVTDALRVDRSAYTRWERAARPIGPQDATSAGDRPLTVRYFFQSGDRQSSQSAAAAGIAAAASGDAAGLYRAIVPTADLASQTSVSSSTNGAATGEGTTRGEQVELLAPEVAGLAFSYFDGTQWWDSWDASQSRGLPRGVDVKLQIAASSDAAGRSSANNRNSRKDEVAVRDVVEYERYVALPSVSTPPATQALMLGAGGRGGPGQNGGQPGAAQNGPGQNADGKNGQGQGGATGATGGGNGKGQ